MAITAQTIIERGMKKHAEVDTNVRALILENLSDFLDELYSIYDLNQAVKSSSITISAETVAMPTDFLRLANVVYDSPWFGYEPTEIFATEYNKYQSLLSTTNVTPPQYVYADHPGRVLRFLPVTSGSVTGKLTYYPQFADLALATDLQFFPMQSLLVLFCYLDYCEYDQAEPRPRLAQAFERLRLQLQIKYNEKKESPRLSDRFFGTVSTATD